MRAVMYHYVRPDTNRPPHEYYYLDLDDFRRQLDYFEETYELPDRETFVSYLADDVSPEPDDLILTFDDGLRDHYEWVLPELRKRDLWGVFFVSKPPKNRLLPVHRIHSMLGSADTDTLVDALDATLDRRDLRAEPADEFARVYAQYDSDDGAQWFKRTLNYRIPYDRLSGVLDELERRVFGVQSIDPAEFYMTRSQLRELSASGMLVGGHTLTHPVLSRLPTAAQRAEIHRSLAFVRDVAAPPVQTFAYPYGGPEMYDETTVELLRAAGCDLAFTTERGDISSDAFRTSPLTLCRRDCNEFEHGAASIS